MTTGPIHSGSMTIAYLVNTAPVTSSTFIRREMAALEAQGVTVRRFALRRTSTVTPSTTVVTTSRRSVAMRAG